MLLKIVTLLSVIFLLGGLGNCQCPATGQNDGMLQILQAMLSDRRDSDKKDDNDLNKVLIELIETLSQRIGSMSPTPDGNKLIEQLMELLRPSYDKPIEPMITERERVILSKVKEYLHHEKMKDLVELINNPRGTFHSIMMTIIDRLEHDAKVSVVKMYTEYLMQTPTRDDGHKNNETMPCMKESCRKMEHKIETSPFLKIMKLEGWKFLFEKEYDHKRFADMVKYIEESHGPMAWFNHLFMATEKNKWIWTIGHQILYMLEKNQDMQHKLMYFVNGHKDLRDIMVKVSKWVKSKDFNMSSPVVKRIVHLVKMMKFEDHDNSTKKHWLDEYMDWVDCNFGKQEELATLMKSVGVMLRNEDPMHHFLHMLDFNPADKIKVTLQLMFSGTLRCNETVMVPQQNLRDLLYVVMGNQQFCTLRTFEVIERKSSINGEVGHFVNKIRDIANNNTNVWKIAIYKGRETISQDVDLKYIVENGDIIYLYYDTMTTP